MLNYHVLLTILLYGNKHADYTRKVNLQKMKINATETGKFVRTEINFILGKNGGCMPSSLGGRLIVMVRQAGKNLAVCKIFKIQQLQY